MKENKHNSVINLTGCCLHEYVEQYAQITPNAPAIVDTNYTLSYAELDKKANQWAHYLLEKGVEQNTPIGLSMRVSIEMVVALIAILKTGGAYVPLDPDCPAERLAFLCENAQISFVFTQNDVLDCLPKMGVQFIDYASIDLTLPDTTPIVVSTMNHAAYLIYTSGSTGRPKGVLCHHQGIINLVDAFAQISPLSRGSRFSLWTTINFDVSVYEIFSAFHAGGALYLVPNHIRSDTTLLWNWLKENQIESAYLPPFFLEEFAIWVEQHSNALPLKRLLVGVEPIEKSTLTKIKMQIDDLKIINAYGPTETAVCATYYLVKATKAPQKCRTPIGKAIPGVDLLVLDAAGQPVLDGDVGELYIGGVGVAHGYWKNPRATADRFVPHPFSEQSGARLYKTGDRVRYLPDGNLIFFGRSDFQVKLHGYRIELGEIEMCLQAHPSIEQAIVTVQESKSGNRWLAAYYIGTGSDTNRLRIFLLNTLPEYMIPSIFVPLDAWPRTLNGKIDRQNLPIPHKQKTSNFARPYTPTEKTLAALWSTLLGVPNPDPTDDFFLLGGHSLLATRLVSRIRDELQVELSPRDIFVHTTFANLARLIEQKQQVGKQAAFCPTPIVPRSDTVPLSTAQEQLWVLQKLSPESLAYQFQSLITFEGKLDLDALQASLDELVARHEILRTTFVEQYGVAVQRIHPPCSAQLTIKDLSVFDNATLDAHIKKEMAQLFLLDRLPLIRWVLFKLGENRAVLFHIEHHIIHDGWSWTVFLREFLALYKVYSNVTYTLPPRPILQFADFACWEQMWLQTNEAQQQRDYWKKQLSNLPAYSRLPSDRPQPKIQTFCGKHIRFDIPNDLYNGIRQISQQSRVTPFILMLTAFNILLYRYSHQTDIAVGSSVANRRFSQLENALGMYVNMLVLRTQLTGTETVSTLLQKVKATVLDAHAHQDYPFGKVVEAINPKRTLYSNPLFQCAFHFHSAPVTTIELPELSYTLTELLENGSAKFDVNIVVLSRPEQRTRFLAENYAQEPMTVVWEYNTDIFEHQTVERMVQHYQLILQCMVQNPALSIQTLDFHSSGEKQFILEHSRGTSVARSHLTCVHLFENQAAQTPHAPAIYHNDQMYTYAQLNREANQLARTISKLGIEKGSRVGISADRTYETIVTLVGILKASATYVPLDLEYPSQRLHFMLADADIDFLITSNDTALYDLPNATRQVQYTTLKQSTDQEDSTNLSSTPTLTDSAYIIYTSGTTGTPKGVQMSHRALANLLMWQAEQFATSSGVRVLQFASLSFDVSFQEIFSTLTTGGELHLINANQQRDTIALLNAIMQANIERIFVPYIVLQNLAATANMLKRWPSTLSLVITAGEQLIITQHIRVFFEQLSTCKLVNQYGPTETHVVTAHALAGACTTWEKTPSIGIPIDNAHIYLLDHSLIPVPVGVVGELHIGGLPVADGYLNQPQLTSEKFIKNPLAEGYLYRTGDLARLLPDGTFAFLGRADNQVKIQGYRVELGEIEFALNQLKMVREAVVVVNETEHNKTLVAYLVLQDRTQANTQAIEADLKQSLPSYLVPSHFIILEKLLRTPTDKVDRAKLPPPDMARSSSELDTAPQNELQKTIANIWQEVLGGKIVGIYKNFFDAGGNSLLAAQVVARLITQLSVNLTLKDIFKAPSIVELETLVNEQGLANRPPSVISMDDEAQLLMQIKHLTNEQIDELLAIIESKEG